MQSAPGSRLPQLLKIAADHSESTSSTACDEDAYVARLLGFGIIVGKAANHHTSKYSILPKAIRTFLETQPQKHYEAWFRSIQSCLAGQIVVITQVSPLQSLYP